MPERVGERESSGGFLLNVLQKPIVECLEEQVEEVTRFVKEIMVVGMEEALNPGLDAEHPERVLVEVDIEILRSWGN